MNEDYSILEQASDVRKVAWVCTHCGCSVEDAARNVLDNPERFLKAWKTSLEKMAVELDALG